MLDALLFFKQNSYSVLSFNQSFLLYYYNHFYNFNKDFKEETNNKKLNFEFKKWVFSSFLIEN